jgi:hypothetical protein
MAFNMDFKGADIGAEKATGVPLGVAHIPPRHGLLTADIALHIFPRIGI